MSQDHPESPEIPVGHVDWVEREQLHVAAADGDVDGVRQLVEGGSDVNAFDELGLTPLHHAARAGSIAAVSYLVSVGADVNAQDKGRAGHTPLGEVAATCSLAMARVLLEAGADPTLPGGMQITALHQASRRKRGDGPAVYELMAKAAAAKGRR